MMARAKSPAEGTTEAPPVGRFQHIPVLCDEVASLVPPSARLLADATVGGGGHAEALLEGFPAASLFGCDRDPEAVAAAGARLARFGERVLLKAIPFAELHHYVVLGTVDFLLADLGVSSHQLERGERGFSFTQDGPLDMRMSPGVGRSAAELVNGADEATLRRWLQTLGEERFAARIARAVVEMRGREPIETTGRLAEIVRQAVPAKFHRPGHHPATRTFQALRLVVNDELGQLEALLNHVPDLLAPGGRVAVIAFHSLEDRMVKERFREWADPCTCPPDIPRCVCGRVPLGRRVTRKPLVAGEAEVAENPRSRSARLRAFERAGAETP